MNTKVAVPLLAAALILPGIARADIAAISLNDYVYNPSFEMPITSCCAWPDGWMMGGPATGDAGSWDPDTYPSELTATDGNQIGYINNYSGWNSSYSNYFYLAQTLPIPMVPGTWYSLTYDVAIRADAPVDANFRVQINGNYSPSCPECYAIAFGSTGSFTPGTWHPFTALYQATEADAGFSPTIYLVNDGRADGQAKLAQVEFDLPGPNAAVPEPHTAALLSIYLGLAGLLGFLARRPRLS